MRSLRLGLKRLFHLYFERLAVNIHFGDVAYYFLNLYIISNAVEFVLIVVHNIWSDG